MSALGQKQTWAAQKAMSDLPPIATAKAKFRKRPCLLYPESGLRKIWRDCAAADELSPVLQVTFGQYMTTTLNQFPRFLGRGRHFFVNFVQNLPLKLRCVALGDVEFARQCGQGAAVRI